MNSLELLKECRKIIAEPFVEKYRKNVVFHRVMEELEPEMGGYHLTGFSVPNVLDVRMQIKACRDEKRKLHYARFVSREPRRGITEEEKNYFIEYALTSIEMNPGYSGLKVSERPGIFMRKIEDTFTLKQGVGIYSTFENPEQLAQELLDIDNLVDRILLRPDIIDPVVLKMVSKIKR